MPDRPYDSRPPDRKLLAELDEVRRTLWPGLPRDEGRARVESVITGTADIETWKAIEEIAAERPDLFTHLFAALKERKSD